MKRPRTSLRLALLATAFFSTSPFCYATGAGVPSPLVLAGQSDREPYLGTWQREVSDNTGSTKIVLELRGDGTYTKTLDAFLRGQSFHGSEDGSWTGNGPVIQLSGDGKFPASRHDLRNYQKLR